jgi:hypothetical protein
MTLALDILGSRYGLLPSEVLVRASTLDLYIVDVAMTYENHSQEQLQEVMNSVKGTPNG